jgi:murein DD-endopeptidase MepM/ murein hydrolase activator NlpD
MAKPRINVMIMTPGDMDRPVRSYSLPGYFPRLAITLGIVLAALLVTAGILTFYYSSRAKQLVSLQEENQSLRGTSARIAQLENELKFHRDFTRRVAGLVGISVPDFADSAGVRMARADSAGLVGPPEVPIATAADSTQEVVLPPGGVLVSDCPPDSGNRPHGLPLRGTLTRGFSPSATDVALRHTGIDLAVRQDTPVIATADGKVEFAGEDERFGFVVVIDHGNGFKTMYGHNSVLLVKAGERIQRGERIALSGNTGISTAAHLHYEITQNGNPIDPTPFLGQ